MTSLEKEAIITKAFHYLNWQGGTIHRAKEELAKRVKVEVPSLGGVHEEVDWILLRLDYNERYDKTQERVKDLLLTRQKVSHL